MKFEVTDGRVIRVWGLSDEFRALLAPIALAFSCSVEDFLVRYSRGPLPGQIPERLEDNAFLDAADHETVERIKRTAAFYEEPLTDYIWRCVMEATRGDLYGNSHARWCQPYRQRAPRRR